MKSGPLTLCVMPKEEETLNNPIGRNAILAFSYPIRSKLLVLTKESHVKAWRTHSSVCRCDAMQHQEGGKEIPNVAHIT